MAEGIGLLNQRTMLLYHGFESLFLRANKKDYLSFSCTYYLFPFFSQKEALKKGQYPLHVISLARFIPYPKFVYVKPRREKILRAKTNEGIPTLLLVSLKVARRF